MLIVLFLIPLFIVFGYVKLVVLGKPDLVQALMLPDQLQHPPASSSISVRGRMAQLLTVWCGQENGAERLSQVVRS